MRLIQTIFQSRNYFFKLDPEVLILYDSIARALFIYVAVFDQAGNQQASMYVNSAGQGVVLGEL